MAMCMRIIFVYTVMLHECSDLLRISSFVARDILFDRVHGERAWDRDGSDYL